MSGNAQHASNSDKLASQALQQNYQAVAGTNYVMSESRDGSEAMQGLAMTYEQIGDNYFSGGNDETFLRNGDDIAE